MIVKFIEEYKKRVFVMPDMDDLEALRAVNSPVINAHMLPKAGSVILYNQIIKYRQPGDSSKEKRGFFYINKTSHKTLIDAIEYVRPGVVRNVTFYKSDFLLGCAKFLELEEALYTEELAWKERDIDTYIANMG